MIRSFIKGNLRLSLHVCDEMPSEKVVCIRNARITLVTEEFDSIGDYCGVHANRVDWLKCPYCGLEFYEEKTVW